MDKLEKLNDRICELNELVHTYEHQLLKERNDSKKARQIHEKIYHLRKEIHKIEQAIEISSSVPVVASEFIDLYKCDENPKGYYTVCLHGTKTIIGEIGCNNENNNIHYVIDEEYRHKGYGFQTVVTMFDYLISKDIENVDIVVLKDNDGSIKLVKKLKHISPNFNEIETEKYIVYHFALSKTIDEKHDVYNEHHKLK